MGIKDLFFKITARDKTGPAFGSVNRRLRETDGLAASVSERMARAGRSMQKFGAMGSVASLGVAAAFRDVIGLYDEQERAEAKVAQAVRATGMAAGFSAPELAKMASGLQSITRFGDENILNNVTAQLLTFKEISGTAFERAQVAALDLATVLDGDLRSASIMLGKALNDPIKGLSAMSRAGITFSEAQADVIKELARTGQVAEAQKLILDEIASAYGGQAEAARKAGAGIVDAWANTWGDVKEVVGGVLIEILPPIIETLESITGWFKELTPEGQRSVVMLGALAVAIPPVTAALGLMVTGMAALSGPVGWVVGGLAALTAGLALLWPEQDKAAQSASVLKSELGEVTGTAAEYWQEQDKVTQATDLVSAALGDEITQSQLLQQALSGDIAMSVSAANQKLTEARSRHENVKAIIAEQRALKLQSSDYRSLLGQISDAEGALNSLGFPARDIATPLNSDAFEQAQQHLADLRVQQQEFLKAGAEYKEHLKRTEENIESLEAAISSAEGGMVTFGNGMTVPIETAERLKQTISGGGSGGGGGSGAAGGGGLTGAVKELAAETEEYANSEGWQTLKSNMRALIVDGHSWEETWKSFFGSVVDRLFDLAFSPAWDQLWANLERGMSGGGGGLFGGLFGGGGGGFGSILGLDTGGDVTVSGRGGVDRNLTVLRTSDSEKVSVRRPGDSMPGGGNVYVTIQTPDVAGFQKSRAQIARQMRGALSRAGRGG